MQSLTRKGIVLNEHYYTQTPKVQHKQQKIEVELRGKTYFFVTDTGVFSREGIDFGSRLLIETMEIASTSRVLDMGCGYGPIGLVAASLAHEGGVTMVDINERAVELAKKNASINKITNVNIFQSDLFANVEPGPMFDTILCNPPIRAGKQTVHQIFEEAKSRLKPDGALWIVIQKKQGASSALEKLKSLYVCVDEMNKSKGFRIYRAAMSAK